MQRETQTECEKPISSRETHWTVEQAPKGRAGSFAPLRCVCAVGNNPVLGPEPKPAEAGGVFSLTPAGFGSSGGSRPSSIYEYHSDPHHDCKTQLLLLQQPTGLLLGLRKRRAYDAQ